MRSLILISVFSVAAACTSSATDARDPGADDSVDEEAKADASRPVGKFSLISPSSFDDGDPRMVHLDLRRNGSFYINETDGGSGDHFFGAYRFTKDAAGNKFLRVTTETDGTWRYRYKVVNGELRFYFPDGDLAWRMKRDAEPSRAHVDRIQEVFASGDWGVRLSVPAPKDPVAVWAHYEQVKDSGPYGVHTLVVDGTKHYMLLADYWAYDQTVDIYAANNQLLATGYRAYGWNFDDELF